MSDNAANRVDPRDAARRWWRELQNEDAEGRAKPGDRAALARLRRATPVSAMAEEATLDLFERLGYGVHDKWRLPRVATLACLLAHVRKSGPGTPLFGRAIGRSSLLADESVLKPLRFRNLLAAEGEDEILRAFRRAVDLLDGEVNVGDLARIVLFFEREDTRRDLAFNYYGAGSARPAIDDTATVS